MVLIDEQPLADGVATHLRAQPGFHVLTVSARIEEALKQVRDTRPDVVLLNLRLETSDSLTLAGALHGEVPASRVIIMGLEPLHPDVTSFIRAGVSGFIMVGAPLAIFRNTVDSVAQGIQVLPFQLTGVLFGQLRGPRVRAINRKGVVTELILQGLSSKEIASRLRIAIHTAESRVHDVLAKLTVNRRLEVTACSRRGTVPPQHGAN